MAKQKSSPYRRSDRSKELTARWRRGLSSARRERVFQLLGAACVDCGSDDRVAVKVRKSVADPFVAVGDLWKMSSAAFEEAIHLSEFKTSFMLLCNPCRSKRIMAAHEHGTSAASRVCKCAECTDFVRERSLYFRKRAQLMKMRTRLRDLEREVEEREQRLEIRQGKRHTSISA